MESTGRMKKKLLKRGWFWSATSIVLLVTIITLFTNLIIRIAIEKALISTGAREASTGRIHFNPFVGLLTIEKLKIVQPSADSLDIGDLDVRFRLLSLVSGRVEIKEIIIRNAHLGFTVQPGERNISEGFGLLSARRRESTSPAWSVSLASARMVDSTIRFDNGENAILIGVDQAALTGLDSWNEGGEIGLRLRGHVNRSPVRTTLTMQSHNNETRQTGDIKIKELQIEQFINFLPKSMKTLAGTLHVDTEVELLMDAEGGFKLVENGLIKLRDINLKSDEIEFEAGELYLQGDSVVNRLDDRLLELIVEGEADASSARLMQTENGIDTGDVSEECSEDRS